MPTNLSLVILGAGGFAGEVFDALTDIAPTSRPKLIGFFDDAPVSSGNLLGGAPYLGPLNAFLEGGAPAASYFIAIGDNARRAALDRLLQEAGRLALSIIHPAAIVSPTAKIKAGAYVGGGCFLGPGVTLGRSTLVNVDATVGHGARIGDYAQLCPGVRISGDCCLDEGVFVGSNAAAAPRCHLGPWSKVAACSFVTHDLAAKSLAVGVPAKVIP